jgi:hypothetical protein
MKKILFVILTIVLLSSCGGEKDNEPKKENIVTNPVIGIPIKIADLEIAQNEFPNQMNWNNAKIACASLGDGWRLPTKTELNLIYQNKEKIGGLRDRTGNWTSEEFSNLTAWGQDFIEGGQYFVDKEIEVNVRAVRTIK